MTAVVWRLAHRFSATQATSTVTKVIKSASVGGIALGCCVLIILLSALNGFENALKTKLLAVVPQGELFSVDNKGIPNLDLYQQSINEQPDVLGTFQFSRASAMLQQGSQLQGLQVTGINIAELLSHPLSAFLKDGALVQQALTPSSTYPLWLGGTVLEQYQLQVGDEVSLLFANTRKQDNFSATFASPSAQRFIIVGRADIGGDIESAFALTSLSALNAILDIANNAQGLHIYFDDPFIAHQRTLSLGYEFAHPVFINDWTRTHGHLYQDIQLVKVVALIVLAIVIAVACFNIVVTLVMAVKHRASQIAILQTLGLGQFGIASTFVLMGLYSASKGIVWGSVLGILIATNLDAIVTTIQAAVGAEAMSKGVYFVDTIPSVLNWHDVVITVLTAWILSFAATLYPALKAARQLPVKHLH